MANWQGTKIFSSSDKYNYYELSRVNNNIQHISELLTSHGFYPVLNKPIKTNYTRLDFPTVTLVNDVRENILSLVGTFYQPPGAPELNVDTNQLQIFDYNKANELELNLQGLYDLIEKAMQLARYSGTFYSGEEIVL